MGHGYDETGIKGVLVITLEQEAKEKFFPLDTPRFYDEVLEVSGDAAQSLAALLPGVETSDFYRITLTGYCDNVDVDGLTAEFSNVKNLVLRDKTISQETLWRALGEDSLEGMYFGLLHQGLDSESEVLRRRIMLAAQISRQILDGQEVTLP